MRTTISLCLSVFLLSALIAYSQTQTPDPPCYRDQAPLNNHGTTAEADVLLISILTLRRQTPIADPAYNPPLTSGITLELLSDPTANPAV
jgi:hypothetical protein